MPAKKRAPTLNPSQLRHVLNVTQATSRHPLRDNLALLFTHYTGLRVTELARLEIRDILWPSGKLRDETLLRSEITKNCKSRMIFITVPKLIEAINMYIEYRVKNKLGATLNTVEYRGLYPHSKILLTHKGSGFELTKKTRKSIDGTLVDYWAADALEARFRELYSAAGFKSCSSHTGRRSYATKLIRHGLELEQVAIILGHSDVEVTSCYIEVEKKRLREMYEVAL